MNLKRPGRWALVGAGLIGAVGLAWGVPAGAAADTARFWPQWRGPLGTGAAPQAKPPLEWSESSNVAWKVPLPGRGKGTPIVWNDLIILTTAVPKGGGDVSRSDPSKVHEFVVMAYSRADGSLKWRQVVNELQPHEGTHQDGTFASASALTDGQRIYAYFGSRGLYALDFSGKVLWQAQLGLLQSRNGFGEGNSPALHDGTLVITWDHEGEDHVIGIDAATGKEKWRHGRDEPTTWATPHIVVHDGKAQAVIAGTNKLVSYDVATGKPVWQTAGLTLNAIPTPVSGDGMVFAMAGFRGNAARAIDLDHAKGEISSAPAVVWAYDRDTPYVPSPLLYQGGLYFLKSNSGILTRLDAKTGAASFTERLEAVPNVYASPVGADGRVYVIGRDGGAVVLEAGPAAKVLATNQLEDGFDASPALVEGEIYLRGMKNLYRISSK